MSLSKSLLQLTTPCIIIILLVFCKVTDGQNTSYNANTISIGSTFNTAYGSFSLSSNSGANNSASGVYSLNSNTNGHSNTVHGTSAMRLNTSGSLNTAIEHDALYYNNASNNVAIGYNALFVNASGSDNTALEPTHFLQIPPGFIILP